MEPTEAFRARMRIGWIGGGRLGRWGLPALTALLAAGVALLLAHYAMRFWLQAVDEDGYRNFGLWTMRNLPSGLWDLDHTNRGPQRLEAWLLGGCLRLFGSPDGFRVARLANIVAYCSTAVPVWLWARRLGAGQGLAAAGSLLAILVPWAFVTATYLTESLAYPAGTWALFAIWAAGASQRLRPLVLALVAVAFATLARSVMALLLILLAVTFVAGIARYGGPAAWRARHSWTSREVAPWVLVVFAAVVAAAVLALDGSLVDRTFGTYAQGAAIDPHTIPPTARRVVADVMSGVGILPAILAVAWVGRSIVRPADAAAWSMAWVALGSAAFVVFSALRGGADERYIMYLAPVLIVCAAAAAGRREIGWGSVGLATAGVLALFGSVPWRTDQQAYGFFVQSAEAFHGRIMLLGWGARLPNVGLSYATVLALTVVAAAALTVLAVRRNNRVLGAALVVGVLGVGLAQLVYVDRHFTVEAAGLSTSLGVKTWVDSAIGDDDGQAGLFVTPDQGDTAVLSEAWRQTAFWNLSVYRSPILASSPAGAWQPPAYNDRVASAVRIDRAGGRIVSPTPVPPYLIEPTVVPVAPVVGRVRATAPDGSLRLVEVARPARVAWIVSGLAPSGEIRPARPATVDVFRADGEGDCLVADALASNDLTGSARVELGSGADLVAVTLRAGERLHTPRLPLHPHGAQRFAPVRVRVRVPSGQRPSESGALLQAGVLLSGLQRVACA